MRAAKNSFLSTTYRSMSISADLLDGIHAIHVNNQEEHRQNDQDRQSDTREFLRSNVHLDTLTVSVLNHRPAMQASHVSLPTMNLSLWHRSGVSEETALVLCITIILVTCRPKCRGSEEVVQFLSFVSMHPRIKRSLAVAVLLALLARLGSALNTSRFRFNFAQRTSSMHNCIGQSHQGRRQCSKVSIYDNLRICASAWHPQKKVM